MNKWVNEFILITVFLVPCMLLGLTSHCIGQDAQETIGVFSEKDAFKKGNEAYKQGDFATAIEYYQQALKIEGPLSEIYYNIGNSYIKHDKKGLALVNFIRALRLDPRSDEIRKNISYIASLIEYKIEDRTNWYIVQVRRLLGLFTDLELVVALWAGVFMLLIILFLLLFVSGKVKSAVNVIMIAQVCVVMICASAVVMQKYFVVPGDSAVVLDAGVDVRYGPSNEDKVIFHLVEGLELYVVDKRAEWSRIVLLNKETGWVLNKDIEVV
ncbi:tetratricopeptide repeat protein [Candidatus Omnitrophota bacterium]